MRILHLASASILSTAILSTGVLSTGVAAADSGWVLRAPLPVARYDHQALLLPDGTVLVAGGVSDSTYLRTSDAYDFRKNVWLRHTATQFVHLGSSTFFLLPLANKHVVALSPNFEGASRSEEYDPVLGTWSAIPPLPDERVGFQAVVLATGDVLVAGGVSAAFAGTILTSCLLYHPATATWTATGSLATARDACSLTLLGTGRVLAAGGGNSDGVLASCETYVPELGAWRPAGELVSPRSVQQACLLSNGNVVVVGGAVGDATSSEEYVPKYKTSSAINHCTVPDGALLTAVRSGALRAGGRVDAYTGDSGTAVDVFSSKTHTWSPGPALHAARQFAAAVTLPSGEVLVLGGTPQTGHGPSTSLASSELYALRPYFVHASDAAGGTVGRTFSYQMDAAAIVTYVATGLPAGIALNAHTGHFGGKPTTPGTYHVHIDATNDFGTSAMALTLTIQPAPAATAPAAPQSGG